MLLSRRTLTFILLTMGAGWGLTQPLANLAVSGGHGAMGLVFWQLVIGALLLSAINLARRKPLPMTGRALWLYLFVALVGTVLPNYASYTAAFHLPSGVMSIVLSAVPMFALPIALMLGTDRFTFRRLGGLALGLIGVALIALPETSLPQAGMAAFLPLALVAPLFYAIEGNVVDKWGTLGLDGLQVLQGASIIGAVVALPLALAMGHWVDPSLPWDTADLALVASSIIHALTYSTYVWMVGRAGAVFTAQVSTLVTGFGVVWAMLLLGESYSLWVWAAMGLMILGLTLVQPRDRQS
jgi:drug/metabolite transporter (DMT)-like permease